jgi:hypothetical protein
MQEIISKRTVNSKHYYLGGGKFRMVKGGNVAHYKDLNGAWQDCQPTVRDDNPPIGFTEFYKKINLPVAIDEEGNRRVYFNQMLDKWLDMGKVEPYEKTDINTYKVEYEIRNASTDFKLTLLDDKAPLKWKFKFNPYGIKYNNGKIESIINDNKLAELGDVYFWSKNLKDKKRLKLIFEGEYAVFEIDPAGMEYPIIIDPQVIITTAGEDCVLRSDYPNDNQDGTFL